MSESLGSSKRRLLLAGGVLLALTVLLVSLLQRRDDVPVIGSGNLAACAKLEGDPARACYNREVGRELSAVGGSAPDVTLTAPAGTGEVTFTSAEASAQPLLCDLHARVGVVDERTPAWLGWTEPLAATS